MKSNKKHILIIVLGALFLGLIAFFITYEFNNELYIKLNQKNLLIDRYKIGNKVIDDDDLITNSSNIIESNLDKKLYANFTISKSGDGDAEFIKNGSASVEYYVQDNSLILEIISLYSVDDGDYTSQLEKRKYIVTFPGERIKNFIYSDSYFYILTVSGNIYRCRMEKLSSTLQFEHDLLNFKDSIEKFNKLDVSFVDVNGIYTTIFIDFNAKELVNYKNKIYALTDDNKYMLLSVASYGEYKNLEYNYIDKNKTFRFFNDSLVFNNQGNARICTDYEGNDCGDDNLYDLIRDDENNIVTVSAAMDVGSKRCLYLIDTNGNLYIEKYNDDVNIFAAGAHKYGKNKVVEIAYLYKDTEPYMLEDVLILFDNGTRMKLGKDISRLDILINEKSKL